MQNNDSLASIRDLNLKSITLATGLALAVEGIEYHVLKTISDEENYVVGLEYSLKTDEFVNILYIDLHAYFCLLVHKSLCMLDFDLHIQIMYISKF